MPLFAACSTLVWPGPYVGGRTLIGYKTELQIKSHPHRLHATQPSVDLQLFLVERGLREHDAETWRAGAAALPAKDPRARRPTAKAAEIRARVFLLT